MRELFLTVILFFSFYFAKAQGDTINHRIKEIDSIVSLNDTSATSMIADVQGSSKLLGKFTATFLNSGNRNGINKILIDFERKKLLFMPERVE